MDAEWRTTCLQEGLAHCPHDGTFADRFATNNPANFFDKSTRLGGYAGAQIAFDPIVIGIEGDWGHANSQSKMAGIPGAEDLTLQVGIIENSAAISADWDASLRGRAGYLIAPNILLFGTAGIAWMSLEASATGGTTPGLGWFSPENLGKTDRDQSTLRGWTWGAGAEALINQHWMLRAEWRRARFEDLDSIFFEGVASGTFNADAISTTIKTETDTFVLGLAYKF